MVNKLELIRRQQVEKLVEIGIKAVALESCNSESVCNAEIIFGSAEQQLSDQWKNNSSLVV